MTRDSLAAYEARFPGLNEVAERLATLIQTLLATVPRIDRVSARAKSPERFAAKAARCDSNGAYYGDALAQIQDQIGARVIVFYKSDVAVVAKVLEQYFRALEREEHVPDSHWKFGYFGLHWIFALPDDVIPPNIDKQDVPRFFELQVKTLFQHAWSEANHDVAYKAPRESSPDQQRRFAYTAAQAWGADRVFEELWQELNDGNTATATWSPDRDHSAHEQEAKPQRGPLTP